MDMNKLQVRIDKLTDLGVCRDSEIVCKPEMDTYVAKNMNN